MSLINKIPDAELKMIERYIDDYGCTDTKRIASVEHILRFWDSAKSDYLYNLLGDQLMITKEITFKQDMDELTEEVRKAISHNKAANEFLSEWRTTFGWHLFPRTEIEDKLPEEVKNNLYCMGDLEVLASNVWNEETFIVPFNNGTSFKVQRGAKITKAMGKIVKGLGVSSPEKFEQFRIACSQGLNQKELKGKLTLSIHPLDYMTMSDNCCDWSSCMSWIEGGCYRQGTVEMMNSPMVVVAYLASDEINTPIGNDYWNSKKWRELMIVTPNIICNVLGYPYRNTNLSKAAVMMLKELAEKNCGFEYKNSDPIIWQQHNEVHFDNGDTVVVSTSTNNMYNDFSDRDHFGFFGKNINKRLNVYYSGSSECMCCGMEEPYLEEEGYLVGSCCVEVHYCEICGERIYDDNAYDLDGITVCEYCYNDHVVADVRGNDHYDENVQELILVGDNLKVKFDSIKIFIDDWNWDFMKDYCSKIFKSCDLWNSKYYVSIDDLTPKGIDAFCDSLGVVDETELRNMFHSKWYSSLNTINLEDTILFAPGIKELYW